MRVDLRCALAAMTRPQLPHGVCSAGTGPRLPIVGKAFPRGFAQQISSQRSRMQPARSAGELTLPPKYPATRVQVRISGRHPMRRKFRMGANRVVRRSGVARRPGAGEPERIALDAHRAALRRLEPNRSSVDRSRPSDMVENRKTCGISIGSASQTPPVTLAAVNVRRLAKMASDDDHEAGRGVRRWVPK